MLNALLRTVPLPWFAPLRHGAVAWPRGSLPRSACIAVLKQAARAHRGRLGGDLSEIRPADAPDLRFGASDSMVMEAVHWFGVQGYEGQVAEVWTSLCRQSRDVLEVGGNVGLFSVIGARAQTQDGARYTVLEPVPEVAAELRANLARNGLAPESSGRVQLLEMAAVPDAAARLVQLNIPDEGRAAPVGAALLDGSELSGRSTARIITVPGRPFADLAQGRDLIKMDAEGIEAALLLAARDVLAHSRPTLLIEVLPEATRLGALLAELAAELGYIISIIPEWGTGGIVTVPPAAFTAALPARYNSKDVLLSVRKLELGRAS